MYFSFFKLKKWSKRRLRLADTIAWCCHRIKVHVYLHISTVFAVYEKELL